MIRWAYVMALLLCISVPQARGGELGATLHNATVMDWGMSTDDAALDAAKDYITGSTDPAALGRVGKRDLQQASTAVAACMRAFSDAAQPPVTREVATPHIMRCMTTAKAAHPWMMSKPLVLAAPAAAAEDNTPEAAWDKQKAAPLPYAAVKADNASRSTTGRSKLIVRIVLADTAQGKVSPRTDQAGLTKEQLAATVIAAAKHYAQTTKANMVGVVLDGGFEKPAANIQLARCNYAPDGKGVTGTDNWTWNDVRAADRGLTAEEQRTGGYLSLEEVPSELAEAVEGSAPLKR